MKENDCALYEYVSHISPGNWSDIVMDRASLSIKPYATFTPSAATPGLMLFVIVTLRMIIPTSKSLRSARPAESWWLFSDVVVALVFNSARTSSNAFTTFIVSLRRAIDEMSPVMVPPLIAVASPLS